MIDDKPVGVITWYDNEDTKSVWISLGYVVPEHRRCGIYQKMWAYMIEIAKELGYIDIQSGVVVNNKPMIAFSEQCGRRLTGYIYTYTLQPYAKPEKEIEID